MELSAQTKQKKLCDKRRNVTLFKKILITEYREFLFTDPYNQICDFYFTYFCVVLKLINYVCDAFTRISYYYVFNSPKLNMIAQEIAVT